MQRKKPEELCQQQDAELCSREQHRERAAQRVAGIAQHLQGVMLTFPKKTNSLCCQRVMQVCCCWDSCGCAQSPAPVQNTGLSKCSTHRSMMPLLNWRSHVTDFICSSSSCILHRHSPALSRDSSAASIPQRSTGDAPIPSP